MSPNGASFDSPGQRPGKMGKKFRALKGRNYRRFAPLGLRQVQFRSTASGVLRLTTIEEAIANVPPDM